MNIRLAIPLLILIQEGWLRHQEEGWLRHQEKDAKATEAAQTGAKREPDRAKHQ
jgi:hypothetical protein